MKKQKSWTSLLETGKDAVVWQMKREAVVDDGKYDAFTTLNKKRRTASSKIFEAMTLSYSDYNVELRN